MPAVSSEQRVELLGIAVDPLDLAGAVERVFGWAQGERGAECRFVVTPNVNHLVMLERREAVNR
ncbi:MAG TPA: hypothetical protein PLU22_27320, partial [Polyangiaceae bacterium]|nr:hypothetical protein [Polyangiaceae bacterium]